MTTLAAELRQRIAAQGPITVADYMAASNAAYYRRDDVFGANGDFVTAPDISQAFGELIGLWTAVTWQAMGAPYPFRLIECGPGRGTLMRDLLRATAKIAGFHAAADIHLVEASPYLRSCQAWALGDREATWHGTIDSLPAGPAIVIANEFLDALPIRQFEKHADGWRERKIGLGPDGYFVFVAAARSDVPDADGLAADVGAVFEICEPARAWAAALGRRLARDGGAALVVDYGHRTSAVGDTLQAVRRHGYHPIFRSPGEADLTAHVDFAAVAAAAHATGAVCHGPVEQGLWLRRLGIQVRQTQLTAGKSEVVAREISAGIRRLIEPDGMGMLFKVLALGHPSLASLEGFAQDGGP
ncbi:MAG: class I SAM-dependent methyltransferase [Alphaproteobacteria bacterium]|nr:class I SAM-dependent methyltransferase [Alphaproteobacteria bacterium]